MDSKHTPPLSVASLDGAATVEEARGGGDRRGWHRSSILGNLQDGVDECREVNLGVNSAVNSGVNPGVNSGVKSGVDSGVDSGVNILARLLV